MNTPHHDPFAEAVAGVCRDLWSNGLVVAGSGNVSMRMDKSILIKGSGFHCQHMVGSAVVEVTDSDPPAYGGNIKPSTDTATHLYIYRHLKNVNAIVHTHSTYATAWAMAGYSIPCCCTMQADEFGGDIPVSAYTAIGDESIGKEVVRIYESTKCPAILLRQHGLFCVGDGLADAMKTAIMAEECAKVTFLARQLSHGNLIRMSDAEIKKNHTRYQTDYGQ